MLILLALALVLAFSVLVVAMLRPPTRPAALLSLYLAAYANIVLVGEIANSFYQLNNTLLWLALHLLLLLAAWLMWRRRGCPSLQAPFREPGGKFLPGGLRASLKSWPDLWVMGVGVAGAFLFSAVLIWVMPPNNNDSLATHMARIGFWIQRGSFFPWPSPRIWQISYPVDMQLQMFWTALFLGTDRIVESIQWIGALVALVAVFGLARLAGASRPQALFSALLLATFPEIILESTTTQNDLVAGTLFAAMLYLLFLGLRQRDRSSLLLSGLALALGLGTKQTLFFLLPGLALIFGLILLDRKGKAFHHLLTWGISAAAAFLLLGIYMFVVNVVNFGNPMGPETAVDAQTGGQTPQSLRDNLLYNTFRLSYQAIDPTGLPDPLCGYSFKAKAAVVGAVTRLVGFPVEAPIAVAQAHQFVLRERYVVQEDAAWYGPLFALLVLPALFYQFGVGLRRRDFLRIGIFILSITFLWLDAAFRPGWDPFQGRYFIPLVMISTALVGFWVRPGRWWGGLRWAIVALALLIMVNTFLQNSGKPVGGQQTIWGMNALERETLQSFYMRRPAQFVEKYVPADATLGLLAMGTHLEYPFFRENFSRRLLTIYPAGQVENEKWLEKQGVDYVLVMLPEGMTPVKMPAQLVRVASDGAWTLYSWQKEAASP